MSTLRFPGSRAYAPLVFPARYKGAYGGRGSGKSHVFGRLLVETCVERRGTLAVCIREVQKTLAQSSKRLLESTIVAMGLEPHFRIF
ncbi:MAG: phage terminase large subunit [Xanthobacteraceae bacterium]